jgi:hypothetical protein
MFTVLLESARLLKDRYDLLVSLKSECTPIAEAIYKREKINDKVIYNV